MLPAFTRKHPLISRLFVPAGEHDSSISVVVNMTAEDRGAVCLPGAHRLQYAPSPVIPIPTEPGLLVENCEKPGCGWALVEHSADTVAAESPARVGCVFRKL